MWVNLFDKALLFCIERENAMKILLIYPYCLEDRPYGDDATFVPIGVYYVGALLKENLYDVEILNCHDGGKAPQKIKDLFFEKRPDVIGFSIVHANRWGGIEMARLAKEVCPEVKTVFGGVGATFLWDHLLGRFKEIDFVIQGEGEYALLDLVRCLDREDHENIEHIKGLAFRRGVEVFSTGKRDLIRDLDGLPNPARFFVYQHVSSSRGCPGNCTFCGSPRFWGHRVRFHSADYFVEQLERLYRQGITFFFFSDDTFTLNRRRVIEICKKILERGLKITWAAISRVNPVNEEILLWMRRAGCIQISYGVESGSSKIRRILNKQTRSQDIERAFRLTVKYGILARAYFIYGCPGENDDTIQETLRLIHRIKPLSIIFYILDIFPGTALYEDFKKRAGVTDDIWLNRIEDIMYFETDPSLTREMILAFGHTLRRDYYRHLPQFAADIHLVENPEFYALHSDFFSRLAMTFSHGDYAGIDLIPEKDQVAEGLYKRALDYHPDHRAFLGLGVIKQKRGAHQDSIAILLEGLSCFPESEPLHMCLGVSYMNLGKYEEALSHFLPFQHTKQALQFIADCYHGLGDFEKKSAFLCKLNAF